MNGQHNEALSMSEIPVPDDHGFIRVDEEISIRDISMDDDYFLRLSPTEAMEDDEVSEDVNDTLQGNRNQDVYNVASTSSSSIENDLFAGDNQMNWFHTYARSADNHDESDVEPVHSFDKSQNNNASHSSSHLNESSIASSEANVNCDDITNVNLFKSLKKYTKSPQKASPSTSPHVIPTKVSNSSLTKECLAPKSDLAVLQYDTNQMERVPVPLPHHKSDNFVILNVNLQSSSFASSSSLQQSAKDGITSVANQDRLSQKMSDRSSIPSPSEGEVAPQGAGGDIFLTGVITKIQKKIVEEQNLASSWPPTSTDSLHSDAEKLSLSALKNNIRQKIQSPAPNMLPIDVKTDDDSVTACNANVITSSESTSPSDDVHLENSTISSTSCKRRYKARRKELDILYDALREIKWVQKLSLKNLIAKKTLRRFTLRHKNAKLEGPKKKPLSAPSKSKLYKHPKIKIEPTEKVAKQSAKIRSNSLSKVTALKKLHAAKSINISKMPKKASKKGAKQKHSPQLQNVQNLISEKDIKVEPVDHDEPNQDTSANQSSETAPLVLPIKHDIVQKVQSKLLQSMPVSSVSTTSAVLQPTQPKDKENHHVSTVFREVQSAFSGTGDAQLKNTKKRRLEDFHRSSIRQSECAFRYKEIVVKKYQNYIHIVLLPNENKRNSLTFQTLRELKEAISNAQKDASCKVLLLSSSGKYFCSGIDLNVLIESGKHQIVNHLSSAIRSFIEILSTFPKPMVAAVNGITIGLGVILLTYCDVVFASDKATFCTPYCRYGYIPEGAGTVTLPQVVGATIASDMLLRGRKLTAMEAHTYGLVSEVFWPTNVMEEVIPRVQAMAEQSAMAMEVTKALLRCHLWEKVKMTLDNEVHILPKQWLSQSCQQSLKAELESCNKHP